MTPPTSTITNPTPVPVQTSAGDGDARYVAGIALVSFSTLLLELALTRLFSVVLFYHFAFLAISIALLGLGAGGVFAFIRKAQLQDVATAKLAQRCCLGSSVAILVALEVVLHVSVSLNLTGGSFLLLTLVYLAGASPFFFTGLMFSAIFGRGRGIRFHPQSTASGCCDCEAGSAMLLG